MTVDRIYNLDYLVGVRDIESGSVSMVLTDPPYVVSRQTNFQSGKPKGDDTDRFRISMDFGEWDNVEFDVNEMCKISYRILKNGGYFISFCDLWKISEMKNALVDNGFKQLRFIEWVKTNPVPINSKTNYLTNAREVAVCAVKGRNPVFNSEYDNGIYSCPICHGKERFHPTQKPLELFKQLILKHTKENDLVCDFFMGSGTTAAACLELNRRFIGFETNKDYYDKACKRISIN